MKIQQIRNATLKIQYGDQTILLDPWLQDKGTGLSAPTVNQKMEGIRQPMNELPMTSQEILSGVDFCLVTHIHPDHFTADYLPKEIKIIVQNEEDRDKAAEMGFSETFSFEGDELKIGNVTITKVPALHGDNSTVAEMMGKGSGYILSGEEKTLYIAGDTVYYESVENTLEKYKPDVIALNCCEATIPVGRLIMNLPDVEMVCEKMPEAQVIATHLDSVNHALVTSSDVKEFAQNHELNNLCVPANGEQLLL